MRNMYCVGTHRGYKNEEILYLSGLRVTPMTYQTYPGVISEYSQLPLYRPLGSVS